MASAGADSASPLDSTLASLDISDTKKTSFVDENDPHVKEWLLPLEPLYKLCLKYYKDNNGKALQIKYEDKVKLVALHKQVTSGKYKSEGNEPGFLDVVGNDRKQAWQSLGDMSKEAAMVQFVKILHSVSPSLKPYIQAYRVQLDEELKQRQLAEEKRMQEEAEIKRQRISAESQQKGSSQQLQEEQVRQALNQQTESQFRQYAQSQFPNNPDQQEALITQLQEQHFQQYVKQVYEQQMQQQQQTSQKQQTIPGSQSAGAEGGNGAHGGITQVSTAGHTNGHQTSSIDSADLVIQDASMWTQKDITTFKNAIRKESKMDTHTDSIIKVGSGETVTIRVPTHDNGSCLFWEFATDNHDIAFGVYFEWTAPTDDNVQVHVSDSSDDEDEINEEGNDPEKGGEEVRKPKGPPVDEIIPIYRRDSHEEVYCGSHVYPGRGVYLLKFDNSYSLWRSKTLYYRVFYSR